jgi:hypothetical protein
MTWRIPTSPDNEEAVRWSGESRSIRRRSSAKGGLAQYRKSRSLPPASEPWMRTEASRLKPPLACQVSMSSTVSPVSRPRRWKRRSTRRCSVRSRRRMSSAVRWAASWKVTLPSAPSAKTPSRTTTWKWKWGLRAEPKRCRKETAPSRASAGADGLARCSVVRMPRSRTRNTSPVRRGS